MRKWLLYPTQLVGEILLLSFCHAKLFQCIQLKEKMGRFYG